MSESSSDEGFNSRIQQTRDSIACQQMQNSLREELTAAQSQESARRRAEASIDRETSTFSPTSPRQGGVISDGNSSTETVRPNLEGVPGPSRGIVNSTPRSSTAGPSNQPPPRQQRETLDEVVRSMQEGAVQQPSTQQPSIAAHQPAQQPTNQRTLFQGSASQQAMGRYGYNQRISQGPNNQPNQDGQQDSLIEAIRRHTTGTDRDNNQSNVAGPSGTQPPTPSTYQNRLSPNIRSNRRRPAVDVIMSTGGGLTWATGGTTLIGNQHPQAQPSNYGNIPVDSHNFYAPSATRDYQGPDMTPFQANTQEPPQAPTNATRGQNATGRDEEAQNVNITGDQQRVNETPVIPVQANASNDQDAAVSQNQRDTTNELIEELQDPDVRGSPMTNVTTAGMRNDNNQRPLSSVSRRRGAPSNSFNQTERTEFEMSRNQLSRIARKPDVLREEADWEPFKQSFLTYAELQGVPRELWIKMLLSYISPRLQQRCKALQLSEEQLANPTEALTLLDQTMGPPVSKLGCRIQLTTVTQGQRSLTEYINDLRQMGQRCGFDGTLSGKKALESALLSSLVSGIRDSETAMEILKSNIDSFEEAVRVAQSIEVAKLARNKTLNTLRDDVLFEVRSSIAANKTTADMIQDQGVLIETLRIELNNLKEQGGARNRGMATQDACC